MHIEIASVKKNEDGVRVPPTNDNLSELEQCVLGVLWRDQPVTPYKVRQTFLESPSTIWSGSAGTIYPLLRRLESRGLVVSASKPTGQRPGREYRLTTRGRQILIEWLNAPMGRTEASDYDPIRVRLHFLAALSTAKQLAFLKNARRALTEQKLVIEQHCKKYKVAGDLIDYHAARGGLHTVRARIKWINELESAITRAK